MRDDPFATPYAVVSDQAVCSTDILPSKWTLAGQPGVEIKVARGTGYLPGPGFCVYRWRGPGLPSPQDFRDLHAVPDAPVLGLSADGPSFSGAPPTVQSGLSGPDPIFERQARGMSVDRWVSLFDSVLASKTPVQVAVIDGSPPGKGLKAPDTSGHGFAVARVIGGLLCRDVNSPACATQIGSYLALPIRGASASDYTEDWVNGGWSGNFSHLSAAIESALKSWDPRRNHLVINLSMGWDPIKTSPDDPNVKMIKSLLQSASQMGALIIGAAGNISGSDGPILPGAFEALPAPGAAQCTSASPLASYAPLVHSIGAVDSLDQRTMIDRRWGEPRLVAFGVGINPPVPPGQPAVPALSGTSMSTAIVSAIAAAVWTARPELTASQVMDLVYQGGVELDGGARSARARTEFCLCQPYGPCDGIKVHRAFMCGALSKALPSQKLNCDVGGPQTVATTMKMAGTGTENPASDPALPCRVSNCGVPRGVAASQLSLATAPHGGGFAGCPGCNFSLLNGILRLGGGTPTPASWAAPYITSSNYHAVLNTGANESFALRTPSDFWTSSLANTQGTFASQATSQFTIVFSLEIPGVGFIESSEQLTPQ